MVVAAAAAAAGRVMIRRTTTMTTIWNSFVDMPDRPLRFDRLGSTRTTIPPARQALQDSLLPLLPWRRCRRCPDPPPRGQTSPFVRRGNASGRLTTRITTNHDPHRTEDHNNNRSKPNAVAVKRNWLVNWCNVTNNVKRRNRRWLEKRNEPNLNKPMASLPRMKSLSC